MRGRALEAERAAREIEKLTAERDRLRDMAPVDLNCGCEGGGVFVSQECSEDRCDCAPNCPTVRYCDCIHGAMVERGVERAKAEAMTACFHDMKDMRNEALAEVERAKGEPTDAEMAAARLFGRARALLAVLIRQGTVLGNRQAAVRLLADMELWPKERDWDEEIKAGG